jgi:hypothetical protein
MNGPKANIGAACRVAQKSLPTAHGLQPMAHLPSAIQWIMTPALLSLLLLAGLATADGPKEDIKQAGKEVGQGFKKGGLAVGHAAKKGGLAVGHAAKKGGVAVGHGAKTAGKGVAKGAKETGHGIKEAVKK